MMWWAVTPAATSTCGAICAEESLPSFYAEACVCKGTDTDARMCRQLVKNDEGVQGDSLCPSSTAFRRSVSCCSIARISWTTCQPKIEITDTILSCLPVERRWVEFPPGINASLVASCKCDANLMLTPCYQHVR
jgi:hypothetical protein